MEKEGGLITSLEAIIEHHHEAYPYTLSLAA